MNAMLAAVLPSMPPGPATAHKAGAGCEGEDGQAPDFAGCMEQALDAAKPLDAPAAPGVASSTDTAPAEAHPLPDAAAPRPDIAALLPGWMPALPPPAAASEGEAAAADPLDTQALATLTTGSALRAAPQNRAEPSRDAATPSAPPTPRGDAQTAPAFAALLTPTSTEAAPAAPPPRAPALDSATPSAGTLQAASPPLPAAAPRPAEAPATIAQLPAAIDSPGFAPALATQVRWWAHDGVQQAQLTLNPPEMGPVAVKIVVLDGREARIDFSADLAATRVAIEAALPVLAAALDESGLRLSGGGVHDGAAQRQAAWQEASQHQQHQQQHRGVTYRTRSDAGAPGATPLATAPTTLGRGLVDLVA
jgi:flagellar hook-length control protein FliK